MQGPSAGKTIAAAGPGDRWSLVVSSLLILGLFIAAAAMVQNWRTAPEEPKPIAAPPKPKTDTPKTHARAHAIRLPPPPAPAAKPRIKPLAPPAPPPKVKPRIIEPLKWVTTAKPPQSEPRPQKAMKPAPLRPAASQKKSIQPSPEKPLAARKPQPEPAPAAPAINAAQHRKTGGALLRLLEHGKGPSVEIAWPASASERRHLFGVLTRCYGMKPALLGKGNRLFNMTGTRGQPWAINRDRYSGFIRSPQGEPIRKENQMFAAIASRHGLTGWRPVRVFPRAVDAVLLGGLGSLLGEKYQTAGQIRAVYGLRRNGLVLTGFRVDGRTVDGVISLPAVLGGRCD